MCDLFFEVKPAREHAVSEVEPLSKRIVDCRVEDQRGNVQASTVFAHTVE